MTLLDIISGSAAVTTAAVSSATTARAVTIAVTSGKGGVGKTNLAVNLAALLARRGRKVILLDTDLGLANADIVCGVRPVSNLSHVMTGERQIADIVIPIEEGFSLIAGASGLAKMADLTDLQRSHLMAQLELLHGMADVLVFDTGAGIGRDVMSFTTSADHIVVVTTPEPTAMMDAYAVLKVLYVAGTEGAISLVVNQVKDYAEARSVHNTIMGVAQRFLKTQVPLGGYIPIDAAISQSVRSRIPVIKAFPRCNATQALNVWADFVDRSTRATDASSGDSFFHRFATQWKVLEGRAAN